MRWITGVLLVLLNTASLTEAATFTVTTTDEQDAAMGALLIQENQGREKPLTPDEFRDYLVIQSLDAIVTRGKAAQEAMLKAAAEKAPAEIKQQIQNLLTCGKAVCE